MMASTRGPKLDLEVDHHAAPRPPKSCGFAMGKGKNKTFKEKLYPIPRCKILVIQNPWGTHGHPTFPNNIGGWFERMLEDEYPGKRINMIFTRPSDTVTLVEVPEDIDITPLLGAHYHCNFLIPPYNASIAISYIYEYNYIKKGPPERQSCWKFAIPSYQSLRSDFAVKFPYPVPSPAPNPPDSLGNLAQPLPRHLLRRLGDPPPVLDHLFRDAPIADVPNLDASSSHLSKPFLSPEYVKNPETQNLLYTSPSHPSKVHDYQQEPEKPKIKQEERAAFVVKADPYDDEETATNLLRGKDDIHPNSVKDEPPVDQAEDFLHSIIGVKKEEPISHLVLRSPPAPLVNRQNDLNRRDNYEPSPDLLAFLATLPSDLVSGAPTDAAVPNPVKVEDSIVDEYRPSDELLATFATLSPEFLNRNEAGQDIEQAAKSEESPVKIEVKAEPIDDKFELGRWESTSITPERTRSTTLATDGGTKNPETKPLVIRVKAEPQESNLLLYSQTRDPRIRPQLTLLSMYKGGDPPSRTRDPRTGLEATSPKYKREAEPADIAMGATKRIKREQD